MSLSNSSREKRLVKNIAILSIGTVLPKAASFITLPILTAFLTKEEYGSFDLITVLVSLLLPAVTLQIQNAAFRFLIDNRGDKIYCKAIVTNIFVFIIPVSTIAVVALYLFLPISNSLNKVLIGIYLIIDILVNGVRQVARGLNLTVDYSVSAVVSAACKLLFAVLFVWLLRMGLTGAIISLTGASFVSLICIVVRIHLWSYIDPLSISKEKIIEMLKYSWPMVPNSLSLWVMRVSDRLVVTIVMGIAANAIYSVANKIPSLLQLAQNTFTMAWQENASIVSKDDDVAQYYSKMYRVIFDFMAGCLGLIICATPILFKIFIKGDYSEAYYQMPILFLAMFFYSMCSYMGGIYVAYKATKSVGITTICAAACNLFLDILLIKKIGLYAASGSTLVSYLLLLIYRMRNIKKIVEIKYEYKHICFVVTLLAIESALCFPRKTELSIINLIIGVFSFYYLNKNIIHVMRKSVVSRINKVKGQK